MDIGAPGSTRSVLAMTGKSKGPNSIPFHLFSIFIPNQFVRMARKCRPQCVQPPSPDTVGLAPVQ